MTPPRSRLIRTAHTLVEVLVAGVLLGTTLVPALRMMRDGVSVSNSIEVRRQLTTFCVSKLDEHLALAAATWQSASLTGNFAAEGYPTLRYRVQRSDAVAAGGIVGRLMVVTSSAWHDANGNNTQDAGEAAVTFATKVARMAVYEDEASP